MKTKMSALSKLYIALILIFLYAPIVVMIFFSFNASVSTSVFSGFSLRWYQSLLHDTGTIKALTNTLLLAVTSSLIATVMGTAAAVGINAMKRKWIKKTTMHVTNIPMMNPEIVTGISMMLLFVFAGALVHKDNVLGFGTMLIAHITFNLPYVILSVLPKLRQMDPHLPEAAMDLGCTPLRAFLKVEIPEILPGVLTGLIMAFTLSLDDFVISYFTAGNGFQTLPIRIYNMTKKTVTPKMYALATIIFFVILALLLISNLYDEDEVQRRRAARQIKKASKEAQS